MMVPLTLSANISVFCFDISPPNQSVLLSCFGLGSLECSDKHLKIIGMGEFSGILHIFIFSRATTGDTTISTLSTIPMISVPALPDAIRVE